jgi:dTDP-4-dehydrorhamnose 3,5-epimerase
VLSAQVDFMYQCPDFYMPGDEYGLAWDDPGIGIEWPEMDYVLSDKDRHFKSLRDSDEHLPCYTGTRLA